jgi:hypothetical protein
MHRSFPLFTREEMGTAVATEDLLLMAEQLRADILYHHRYKERLNSANANASGGHH